MKWFKVNCAWHDFWVSKVLLLLFDLNINNLHQLVIYDFLRESGVRRPSIMRIAATRTLFLWGQNLFMGGQIFLVGLHFSRVLCWSQKKKMKRLSCQFDLLLSEFYVDLKKKGQLAKLFCTYLLVFCWFPIKKKPPCSNYRKGKRSLGGHAGHFRGAEFLFRGAPLPFPP